MMDQSILVHEMIERYHGRDLTDHEDTEAMIAWVSDGVWSQGPFDVGHCITVKLITLDISDEKVIYWPQYRWPVEADQGMEDTLCGLLDAGVLEVFDFPWNTPL